MRTHRPLALGLAAALLLALCAPTAIFAGDTPSAPGADASDISAIAPESEGEGEEVTDGTGESLPPEETEGPEGLESGGEEAGEPGAEAESGPDPDSEIPPDGDGAAEPRIHVGAEGVGGIFAAPPAGTVVDDISDLETAMQDVANTLFNGLPAEETIILDLGQGVTTARLPQLADILVRGSGNSYADDITITLRSETPLTLYAPAADTRHFRFTFLDTINPSSLTLVLENITLEGENTGGGIETTDVNNANYTFTLSGGAVQNCYTTGHGGGLRAMGGNSHLGVTGGAKITGNTTKDVLQLYGGGIYSEGAVTLLQGAEVSGNHAGEHGGGVYAGGAITAIDAAITGNSVSYATLAGARGGGLCGGGNITLSGTTAVSGNTIGSGYNGKGGGIYIEGGTLDVSGSATVSGNAVQTEEYWGSNRGGGIHAWGATVILRENASIAGNTVALSEGGGIYAYGTTIEIHDGATLHGNTAGGVGGAIYIDNPASLTFHNITSPAATFAGNQASNGVDSAQIDPTAPAIAHWYTPALIHGSAPYGGKGIANNLDVNHTPTGNPAPVYLAYFYLNETDPAPYATEFLTSPVTLPAAPTAPARARFYGWNTSAGGTGEWLADPSFTPPTGANLTAYAVWEYEIGLTQATGGALTAGAPYALPGKTVTLALTTSPGYTHTGWQTDPAGLAVTQVGETTHTFTMPNGPVTVQPLFTPITYSITYHNVTAGENPANPAAYTVEDAEITLAAPTRQGYTFAGWYGDPAFTGAPVTSLPAGSTGAVELYAKWTKNPATWPVLYHANGGEGTPPPADTLTEGVPYTIAAPDALTPPEYHTFAEWNTDPAGGGDAYAPGQPVTPTGPLTLYATWQRLPGPAVPAITAHPAGAVYTQGATAASLTVAATAATGTLGYQWYSNGADNTATGTAVAGATGSSYTPPTGAVGDTWYYVVVTSTLNGLTESVTSQTAKITVEADSTTTTTGPTGPTTTAPTTTAPATTAPTTTSRPVGSAQDGLSVTGVPATIRVGDTFTLIPEESDTRSGADGWSWDAEYFSATFNSPATFTALKAGTTTITFTSTTGRSLTLTLSVLEKKTASSSSGGSGSGGTAVTQTGDSRVVWPYALLAALALLLAGGLLWYKRRQPGKK